jgi:hypothetical protein
VWRDKEREEDVLVCAARVVVARLDWRSDMSVDPERPESVVKVKSHQFG